MLPTSIYPTAIFDKLDETLLELEQHDKEIQSGVASVGDAAAYALVWEWGNVRQHKPGPKTVIGTNAAGKRVWLSIQAPFGYLRINEPTYWEIINQVIGEMEFNQPNARAMTQELERGAKKISKMMAQVVKDAVPVDQGDLRDSIVPVDPGDSILTQEKDEYETLVLEEE